MGRFLNADAFASTGQGPQGYNMFSYCGNNPTTRKDYSGTAWDIAFDVITIGHSAAEYAKNPNDPLALAGLVGDVVDLLLPCVSGIGESIKAIKWVDKAVDSFGNLSKAAEYGIDTYKKLKNALKGTGLHAHHIIEKRLVAHLGIDVNEMLSVAVTPAEHQVFTNAWREVFKYGMDYTTLSIDDIWSAAQEIYKDYPILLDAAEQILFG